MPRTKLGGLPLLITLISTLCGLTHDALSAQLPELTPASPATSTTPPYCLDFGSRAAMLAQPLDYLDFCSEWNPEFSFNGYRCCSKIKPKKRRRGNLCDSKRFKASFCDEMTATQRKYRMDVSNGKIKDPLSVILKEMDRHGEQAFCSVNNGFLAWGREIIPTAQNRIQIRVPDRCSNFGTDHMAAMMEWLGREVATKYSAPEMQGVKLLVADISSPRGGCLAGRVSRRGHASHTAGQDGDIGFIVAKPGKTSPGDYVRDFDAEANWWLVKKILNNPYACVKVIFLDKKLINKLYKQTHPKPPKPKRHKKIKGKPLPPPPSPVPLPPPDPDWDKLHKFIRHMPSHKNHFHVRVGDTAGPPGCTPNAQPELETEMSDDALDLGLDETPATRSDIENDDSDDNDAEPSSEPTGDMEED